MVAANHGDKLVRNAISHSHVRQFSIVGFGIMLSSKIYSRKVSQRLIIENFVPQNYLAIRYSIWSMLQLTRGGHTEIIIVITAAKTMQYCIKIFCHSK